MVFDKYRLDEWKRTRASFEEMSHADSKYLRFIGLIDELISTDYAIELHPRAVHFSLEVSTESRYPDSINAPGFSLTFSGKDFVRVQYDPKGSGTHNIETQRIHVDKLSDLVHALLLRLTME